MEARPEVLRQARALRKAMTRSEVILWQAIRGGRLDGVKFRRQHPYGPYVLDFFCAAANLAIEVDGGVHRDERQAMADYSRDQALLRKGVRTLRVPDAEVFGDLDGVLAEIRRWLRREA